MTPALPSRNIMTPPQAASDRDAVQVPRAVADILPRGYGYGEGHIAADLVAMFEGGQRRRLRQISRAWETHPRGSNALGPMQARSLATDYYKFFARFPRTPLFAEILEHCGGDPAAAARALLEMISAEIRPGGGRERGPAALGRVLDQARKGLRIPFMPPGSAGHSAGSGTLPLTRRTWNIAKLVERLKLDYEQYSRPQRVKYREVPYPDDLDVVSLRSLTASDLVRITTQDLLLTDADFYPRLARRELRQVIYQEPEPIPPRRFEMLIDVSQSMEQRCGHYQRCEFAVASAICLLSSALRGGNEVVLRTFDGSPHDAISGTPAEIVRHLLEMPFSGGGTSINRALERADKDQCEEIILITDGEDSVSYSPQTPLLSYLCGGDNDGLRKRSRKAYDVHL